MVDHEQESVADLSSNLQFRLSLRMVTGFVQSLIKLSGLDWTAPDYSTLCRMMCAEKTGGFNLVN